MDRILDYATAQPLPRWSGCIATIGVFDGLHLGHRAILDRALAWARTERRPAVLVTFSVHPDLVVHGRAPEPLLSLDHRLREVERAGIDAALVLRFDAALRELSAEAFVEQILVGSLRVHGVVLGHDTAVGRDRRGDARLLRELGGRHGFEVVSVGRVAIDGEVVSSTRIRELLRKSDLDAAARLLGRAPSVLGTVVRGDMFYIRIGDRANVQDNCVLHTFPSKEVRLEEDAHIGHGAVLHGCTVKRNANGLADPIDSIRRKRNGLVKVKVELADGVVVSVCDIKTASGVIERQTYRRVELSYRSGITIHIPVTGRTRTATGKCRSGWQCCPRQIAGGKEQRYHGDSAQPRNARGEPTRVVQEYGFHKSSRPIA